jgi:hypothetical protein
VGTLLVGVVAIAAAAATIVPEQGIAGVTLRMTQSQVRADLGRPTKITRSHGALGSVVTRLHYSTLDVDVQVLHGEQIVVRVLTTSPTEHTTSGIGVGSPLAAVKRLSGVHCWWEASSHYCASGDRFKPLSRQTLFWIGPKQRVTLVSVSLIVNS